MSTTLSRRTRTGSALASISGFAAAWMAMMATRYFALSADDINGGIGIGVDEGSWLSTAYSACEPIGVILGCWLSVGLSIRRVLLASVAVFIVAMLLPAVAPGFMILLISRALTGAASCRSPSSPNFAYSVRHGVRWQLEFMPRRRRWGRSSQVPSTLGSYNVTGGRQSFGQA